jgi:undecaprenyl-phosphate 4-deoxy-4-formamido-L-arabinose transferase
MVALFSGAQMLSLGVIGEYLGRLHTRSMGKPTYAVRRDSGAPGGDPGTER